MEKGGWDDAGIPGKLVNKTPCQYSRIAVKSEARLPICPQVVPRLLERARSRFTTRCLIHQFSRYHGCCFILYISPLVIYVILSTLHSPNGLTLIVKNAYF